MIITGQDYEGLTDIWAEKEMVVATFLDTKVNFTPEAAIKVAHELLAAAEKIIKK